MWHGKPKKHATSDLTPSNSNLAFWANTSPSFIGMNIIYPHGWSRQGLGSLANSNCRRNKASRAPGLDFWSMGFWGSWKKYRPNMIFTSHIIITIITGQWPNKQTSDDTWDYLDISKLKLETYRVIYQQTQVKHSETITLHQPKQTWGQAEYHTTQRMNWGWNINFTQIQVREKKPTIDM